MKDEEIAELGRNLASASITGAIKAYGEDGDNELAIKVVAAHALWIIAAILSITREEDLEEQIQDMIEAARAAADLVRSNEAAMQEKEEDDA